LTVADRGGEAGVSKISLLAARKFVALQFAGPMTQKLLNLVDE
jgi:hypothetical protein